MFEASVDGQPYDPDLFGQYYKPAGLQVNASNQSAPAPAPVAATPEPTPAPAPVAATPEPTPAPTTSGSTSDILNMIRQRKGAE